MKSSNLDQIKDEISKTMLIPLALKARDFLEKNSILKDNLSHEIAEKLGLDLDIKSKKASFVGTNSRAFYIDSECERLANSFKNPVIVNLGAGLDTRTNRLKERVNSVFYELDLDEVIRLRENFFKDENVINTSMFETAWMDELAQKHPESEFIFACEGVLMYFTNSEIKELFANLATRFNGAIIADIINVWMSKNQQKHDILKNQKAKFSSGFNDSKELESRQIKLVKEVCILDINRWRYGFKGVLWRCFMKNSFRIATFSIKK